MPCRRRPGSTACGTGRALRLRSALIMVAAFLVAISTRSTRCTASAAIAASCSGSRCRFPISRPCCRRRAFRSWFCRCRLRDRGCHGIDHAAAEDPRAAGQRCERRDAVDTVLFQMGLMLLYHLITVHVSGTRRSTAGCCWSRPGRGARRFYGPSCRRSRLAASRRLHFTLRISSICCTTASRAAALKPCTTGKHRLIRRCTLHRGDFLSSPGLWIGLLITAGFLAAAVRLRRSSGTDLIFVCVWSKPPHKVTAR